MQSSSNASTGLLVWLCAVLLVPAVGAQESATTDSAHVAKNWTENAPAIEQHLRHAEVAELRDIGTGVTTPRRAQLVPGGPVAAFAWKDIKPGIYRGHFESYQAEVAAYELDKLLELGMTPPTVERRVHGELGAAIYWVSAPTWQELGGVPTPPSTHAGWWYWQLVRAKMFHNLIGNTDPNEGNWLVDGAWNLILIDSSRAFTTDLTMAHRLTAIDRDLWERMLALDEATLAKHLGDWIGNEEIGAIVKRRTAMQARIEQLVAERGEDAVFVQYGPARVEGTSAPDHRPADVSAVGAANPVVPLIGQLLNQAPLVLPYSEVAWTGTVVRLDEQTGADFDRARRALCAGHAYGLATEFAGWSAWPVVMRIRRLTTSWPNWSVNTSR